MWRSGSSLTYPLSTTHRLEYLFQKTTYISNMDAEGEAASHLWRKGLDSKLRWQQSAGDSAGQFSLPLVMWTSYKLAGWLHVRSMSHKDTVNKGRWNIPSSWHKWGRTLSDGVAPATLRGEHRASNVQLGLACPRCHSFPQLVRCQLKRLHLREDCDAYKAGDCGIRGGVRPLPKHLVQTGQANRRPGRSLALGLHVPLLAALLPVLHHQKVQEASKSLNRSRRDNKSKQGASFPVHQPGRR